MNILSIINFSFWKATSLEGVLITIRTGMISGGARIDADSNLEYSMEEAKEAYKRVSKEHGWSNR